MTATDIEKKVRENLDSGKIGHIDHFKIRSDNI